MKKDIVTLWDLSKEDYALLLRRALTLKTRFKKGIIDRLFTGKTLGLLFEKASTRTRISFEAAMVQLGGTPIYMNIADTQLSRNEPIKDTARVLSRYVDCLAVRTYSQKMIEELACYASIPVINALSDLYHPCQVLSDIMTIAEYKKDYQNIKIAWVGDGNNVANSWINAASVFGLNLTLACPDKYTPNPDVMKKAWTQDEGEIVIINDPFEAVKDADVIYTDVWTSMGKEEEKAKRDEVFRPFQVNKKLVKAAKKDVIVMHCLPAHRDEEITEEVLEGPNSVVLDQSENKMHMHKAILETLIIENKREEC